MSLRAIRVAVVGLLLGATLPTLAAEPRFVGTWKLVSYAREDPATGTSTFPWGEKPLGLLLYQADGHMSVVINAEGRQPVAHGDEGAVEKQAKLYRTMTAYAGTYTVGDGTVTHRVDVASEAGLVGSALTRNFRIEGDLLTLRTPPSKSMNDGKMYVYTLVWKRSP